MPITVDITKAKVITKDRLRADRKPLLEAQDILFMKAQEAGSDTSAMSARVQALATATWTDATVAAYKSATGTG